MSASDVATARLGHAAAAERPDPQAARVVATRPTLGAALALARVEGWLLARNTLVAGGLVVAALLAWTALNSGEPQWWSAGWKIGYAQMILSGVVLLAAHLAAGRARRNNMEDLYDSFPVTARTRTAGFLLSVLGAVPSGLILVAVASAIAVWLGAVGSPDPAVLAGGVLLVIAGGTIGVAVGIRFPHPFVGVLTALVWVAPFSQSNRFNGAFPWLFPWAMAQQLGQFPQPLPGYPPGGAHALELAGIAALAAVMALAWRSRTAVARGAVIAAGGVAVAVICIAGAVQLQPISSSNLNLLVAQAATPVRFQTCSTAGDVRYCLYPDFASLRSTLESPVNAVLAYVPTRPQQALTVEQAVTFFFQDPTLIHGHPGAQIEVWHKQLAKAPVNHPSKSVIFVRVGSWPADHSAAAGTARLQLALATADWAVGLPPSAGLTSNNPCVPLNQAREPIAIWMTLEATHANVTGIQDISNGPYLAGPGPQITSAGSLLAQAMSRLPVTKVTHVLERNWSTWTNGHSTDAQLAAALGIPLPVVSTRNPTPEPGMSVSVAPPGTPTPQACTP